MRGATATTAARAAAERTGRALLAAGLAAAALPGVASAQQAGNLTPSSATGVLGATGLLFAPSAYVARGGEVRAYLAGHRDLVAWGATFGLRDRFEVGVGAGWDRNGGGAPAVFGAKATVLRETLVGPAVSVGVVDAFAELHDDPGLYVVASKYLIPYFAEALTGRSFGLQAHLGFGGGLFGDAPFGGLELLPGGDAVPLSALAEVVHGDLNVGLRFRHPRSGFQATLGLFDGRRIGGAVAYSMRMAR